MTVLYLWRVEGFGILRAIHRMGFDRFTLRRSRDVLFFKSLGTGSGERFTPRDANPRVWGLIVVLREGADQERLTEFDHSRTPRMWRKFAVAEKRVVMKPISSHGKWAGHEPFIADLKSPHEGKVVAITRARIKWRKNFLFWSAVPPVTATLHQQKDLEMAIGIGEAPLGLQGTFSIWKNAQALRDFAYREESHTRAIASTRSEKWYGEELFARFTLIEERGSI